MCLPKRQKSKSPLPFLRKGGKNNFIKDSIFNNDFNSKTSNFYKLKLIINRNKSSQESDISLFDIFILSCELLLCFLIKKNSQHPFLKYYLVLFFLCFLSYSTALNTNSEFVHDDLVAVIRNPDVFDSNIKNLFFNDFWGEPMSSPDSHKSYRPFTVLTFRINMQISRFFIKKPLSYEQLKFSEKEEIQFHQYAWTFRLVNVLLHAILTLLSTFVLIKYFNFKKKHAFLFGFYFAVHPIHTEAVSSIVGRADLLAAIFMMISFIFYKRLSANDCLKTHFVNIFLFITSSILALLSKETGITILLICIMDFIYNQNTIKNKFSENQKLFFCRKQKKLSFDIKEIQSFTIYLKKKLSLHDKFKTIKQKFTVKSIYNLINGKFFPLVLSLTMLFLLLCFRLWILHGQLPVFTSQDNPAAFSNSLITRTLTFLYLAAFNFNILVMPSKLSYDWQMNSISLIESFTDKRNLITLIVYLSFLYLVLNNLRNKKKPLLNFAISFLILPYIPASNLFVNVGFVVAERILYIPSIGFSILLVLGYIKIMKIIKLKKKNYKMLKKYVKCSIIILLTFFFMKTLLRNQDWLTRKALFESGLRDLPHNAKIQYNYANLQKDLGKIESAINHYRNALRYWPNYESSHNNLAVLLDDLEEAEKHLLKTIKLNPFHSKAYFNLANIYSKKGMHKHAIGFLKKSIELNIDFAEAYSKLGSEYVKRNNFNLAMQYHQFALKLQPKNADFLNNYGVFLHQIGKFELAILEYKKALKINSNHKTALENLNQLISK